MPFKSKSQIRKFRELSNKGKISEEKLLEWLRETPNQNKLPDRVPPKNPRKVKVIK